MTPTSTPGGENDGPDAVRKAGLRRALFGTVVLLGLSAALWWVDGEESLSSPSLPVPDATAPAEVTAQPPIAPPASASPAAPPSEAPAQAGQLPSDASPPGVAASPAADAPPPVVAAATAESVASANSPALSGTAPAVPAPAPPPHIAPGREAAAAPASAPDCPAPAAEAPPRDARPAASPTPALASIAAPGPGYLIQLGVFLDPGNADSMRRDLERKGYPAHLQARVVLGPYPDRATALAAQQNIRRERKVDGMILGPRK